jgi:hypothetical protein
MDKIGLVLLVFAFVLFCIASWLGPQPHFNRLIAAGLAFLAAAMLFGNAGAAFK